MFDVHRDVLSKFVKHPALKDVATYHGYKGDYMLKMTTRSAELVEMVDNYCKMKDIEIVVKPDLVNGFDMFIIAKDDDVVPIKVNRDGKDPWSNK